MKKWHIFCKIAVFFLLTFVFLSGCQRVFTFSPFAGLQRDPADMTPAQQQQYALDALASGDPAAMAEAYLLIAAQLANDPNNGALHLLAADLAIGASGIGNLVNSYGSGSTGDQNALTQGLNTDLLAAVDTHIQQAESTGEEISDGQYVNAGAAIIFKKAADNDNGFDGIDWDNDEDVLRAKEYGTRGGVDIQGLFGSGSE